MGRTDRRLVRLAAPLLSVLLIDLALAAGATGQAEPPPDATITATPATDLEDGQRVTLEGTAAPSGNAYYRIHHCPSVASSPVRCQAFDSVSLTDDGTWRTTAELSRFVYVGVTETDCAGGCVLLLSRTTYDQATETETTTVVASTAISFDPDETVQRRPVVEVTPRRDLTDGQEVSVTGRRFAPYARVVLQQCVAGSQYGCDGNVWTELVAGPTGRFRSELVVRRTVVTYEADGPRVVDCAARRCVVLAGSDSNRRRAAPVRLRFDSSEPTPGPTIEVRPRRNLRDGQEIEINLTNVGPDYRPIFQCARLASGQPDRATCNYLNVTEIEDGEDGSRLLRARVRRELQVFTEEPEEEEPARAEDRSETRIDCGAEPKACVVLLDYFGQVIYQAISFDPDAPVAEFELAVRPRTALVDGQTVRATVSGGSEWTYFVQCPGRPPGGGCTYLEAAAREDGRYDVTVSRFVRGRERIDCVTVARPCRLFAYDEATGRASNGVALRFAPAPPPVDPTVRIEPGRDLTDRQPVTVTVSTAEGGWWLHQCTTEDGWAVRCRNLAVYDAAVGDGETTGTIYPSRVIGQGDRAVDCASTVCQLLLFSDGYLVDELRLRFDPDAPLAPAPTLRVRPRTDLADGQEVRVILTSSVAGSLWQCAAAAAGPCSHLKQLRPDPPGEPLRTEVTVRRILPSEAGGVDCAVAACELRFVPADRSLTVSVRIRFDLDLAPPGPLSMRVRPRTDLVDRQQVTVSLSGQLPRYFDLQQCLVTDYGVAYSTCRHLASGSEQEAARRLSVELRRILPVPEVADVDCALTERCAVVLSGYDEYQVTERVRYVTFDPDVPPAPTPVPAVTVEPTTGLADGDVVTVTGTGWDDVAPPVFVLECAAEEYPAGIEDVDVEGCDTARLSPATPVEGAFNVEFAVDAGMCEGLACFLVASDAAQTGAALGPELGFG